MTVFLAVATVLAMLALAVRLAGRQHRLLHLFQLEHYERARLLLWLRRRSELFAPRELVAVGALYAAAIADLAAGADWFAGALLLLSTPIAVPGLGDWRRAAVKPLVFTDRAKRLFAVAFTPAVLLVLAALVAAIAGLGTADLLALLIAGFLLLALAPWGMLAADRLLAPVQEAVNRRYVNDARRTLAEVDPLIVAITGSYGKTTTKFCVGEVLAADRPTLVTPESYNSFLGVTRTINERLERQHETFVVEMGMFRRGDIAELCDLANPKVGVITAIGPMHLERLGSIEEIALAKAELLEALPPDGRFVTNADDPRCLEIAGRARVPVTLFGIENPQAQVLAGDVRLIDGRTVFDLRLDGPDSPAIGVSVALLGRHNVSNLLAAAAVGRALEIDPARIAQGLARVRAPAHRLQPIHNRAANIVVIDDAYNSNPEGAQAALEVLEQHPATRRLLVTPGMVELGEMEVECNRRLGRQAAAVCDLAILVGPARTAPIREGLAEAGMDAESVHVVRDIAEATTLLGRLTRSGDVVLFENDLPDTYEEEAVSGKAPSTTNNLSRA
jgi:UDP-N-acetylmuramoyl-tripeptide--D-alanyl-D-alanine ligase